MNEALIDLSNDQEDSVVIIIKLHDPADHDGIDVYTVEHDGELYYFEADEDCDAVDIVSLAVQTIRENL